MPKYIELPDKGEVIEFPGDMPDDKIERVIREQMYGIATIEQDEPSLLQQAKRALTPQDKGVGEPVAGAFQPDNPYQPTQQAPQGGQGPSIFQKMMDATDAESIGRGVETAKDFVRAQFPSAGEQGARGTLENIGQVYPMLEAAAAGATGIYGGIASGLAGLMGGVAPGTQANPTVDAFFPGATVPEGAERFDIDAAGTAADAAARATIYQPQSERGQQLTGAAMYPFEQLHESAQMNAEFVYRETGDPDLAALAATGIEGLAAALVAMGYKPGAKLSSVRAVEVQNAAKRAGVSPDITIGQLARRNKQVFESELQRRMQGEGPAASPEWVQTKGAPEPRGAAPRPTPEGAPPAARPQPEPAATPAMAQADAVTANVKQATADLRSFMERMGNARPGQRQPQPAPAPVARPADGAGERAPDAGDGKEVEKPQAPTKREKALTEYQQYVESLTDEQRAAAGELIELDPARPSLQTVKIKRRLREAEKAKPAAPEPKPAQETPEASTPQTKPWEGAGPEREGDWYGTKINIKGERKSDYSGPATVKRVLNNGKLIEASPEGLDSTFRYDSDRVEVVDLVEQAKPKAPTLHAAPEPKAPHQAEGYLYRADGKPYATRGAAVRRARKDGGEAVEVDGGWAVRTGEDSPKAETVEVDGVTYRKAEGSNNIQGKKVGRWEFQYNGEWRPVRNVQKRIAADAEYERAFDVEATEATGASVGQRSKPKTEDAAVERGDATQPKPLAPESEAAKPDIPIKKGETSVAYTADNAPVKTRYGLVEASDLITSHNPDTFAEVKNYPQSLQNRDRSGKLLRIQVNSIGAAPVFEKVSDSGNTSTGAPIIGPDGVVESGNGRTMGLQQAYKKGTAAGYRDALAKNAPKYGLDPAAVKGMKAPVLVRVRTSTPKEIGGKDDRGEAARAMGRDETAGLSSVESAMDDVYRMSDSILDLYNVDSDGNILSPSNQDFVNEYIRRVGKNSAVDMINRETGRLSKNGVERIKNFILAKAYQDQEILSWSMEDANPDVKNILNGLTAAAGDFAKARVIANGTLGDYGGIIPDIVSAAKAVKSSRTNGTPLEDVLEPRQGDLFSGDFGTPEYSEGAKAIARFINDNIRSGKRLGNGFSTMGYSMVQALNQDRQGSLFGDDLPAPMDIIEKGVKRGESGEGKRAQGDIFDIPQSDAGGGRPGDRRGREGDAAKGPGGGKGGGSLADKGGYADIPDATPQSLTHEAIFYLAKDLMDGKIPAVKRKLGDALGRFQIRGENGQIVLRADLAQDRTTATKVLAHEIGHVVDWLPDKYLKRGNILGRIASLKEYLKHTIDEKPTDPSKFLSPKDRARLRREAQKEAEGAEVAGLYQKKVREEIKKRGLITRDEIMSELKGFTQEWKPFDAEADPNYTKYRFSGVELYADAFSAFLTNPAFLRDKAPKFYGSLIAYMNRKPKVKAAYDAILNDQAAGRIMPRMVKDLHNGFDEGEKRFALKIRDNWEDIKSVDNWGVTFIDRAFAIQRRVALAEKQGANIPDSVNPVFKLEDMVYSGGEIEAYLTEIEGKVIAELEKMGASAKDFGEYLFHHRVMNERSELFNPGDWSPDTSRKRIEELDGNWPGMAGVRDAWWDIRKRSINDKVKDENIFSPELIERFLENRDYATFQVVKYMEDTYGAGDATAAIFRQFGTLQDIANPFTSTVLKDAAIIRMANRQIAAQSTRDFLKEHAPEDIRDADTQWNGKAQVPVKPKEKGWELLTLMEGGKIKGYYVPEHIARAFIRNPWEGALLARIFRVTAQPFRTLFTGINPGFWLFNIVRDYMRMTKNMKGATPTNMLTAWAKAWGPAMKSAMGNTPEEILRMLRENELISVVDFRGDNPGDTEIERLLKRYRVRPSVWNSKIARPFGQFWHYLNAIGSGIERVPKIAADRWLRERYPDMSQEVRAHIVRTHAGSPAFLRKGTADPILNNLLLFSNAIKEGWRGDIEAMRKNPTGYAMNTAIYQVMPKLLMWAASMGVLGAGIKELMDRASDYDKANYTVIPLGRTPNGKAVYLRVPNDEMGRLAGGVMWKGLTKDSDRLFSDMFDYAAGQVPGVNPFFKALGAVSEYASGRNPYDTFRGREAIPKEIFEAGGKESHQAFAKWLWNQSGGGIIHRFRTEDPGEIRTEVENIIGFPLASNIVGRFIKVSDYGIRQDIYEDWRDLRQSNAQDARKITRAIERTLDGKKPTDDQVQAMARHPKMWEGRIMRAMTAQNGDVFLQMYLSASNEAQRLAVLRRFMIDKGMAALPE